MSKSAVTTPRMQIAADPTPLPTWAGVKFTCGWCFALNQLEAADQCDGRVTPACRCGARNLLLGTEDLLGMLAVGLEAAADEGEEGGYLGGGS